MPNQSYQSLIKAAQEQLKEAGSRLPPVMAWNPQFSGDMDLRIASDGTWYHQGDIIQRQSLINLFSTVLKREGEEYFLVTPVEKWRIKVDDAPFMVVTLDIIGKGDTHQTLVFTCDTGDRVIASLGNPIRIDVHPQTGEPSPYVLVRRNLEAKINRAIFYQLADIAERHQTLDNELYGVVSQGQFFKLE